MNILVCVKRVPMTGGKIVLTPDEQAIATQHLGFTISPHEECGVEEAVRIVEQQGGSSTVLTLGPAAAEEQLRDALASQRTNDVRRGITHAGPHRDDLELTLGGRELRLFGSGGQQRTAAIALRMLEGATLRARYEAEPLLLLDDPFAELDARRSSRILELLRDAGLGQTMLAVPRASDIPPELTRLDRWTIAGGVLSPSSHG